MVPKLLNNKRTETGEAVLKLDKYAATLLLTTTTTKTKTTFFYCLEITLSFAEFEILQNIQTLALANNLKAKNADDLILDSIT